MKIKIKVKKKKPVKNAKSLKERDEKKLTKVKLKLNRYSEKKRASEIAEEASVKPLKRETPSKTLAKSENALNAAGNRRGLHNRINPPDSAHMRKIRSMRKFYNKQMPVLQCNSCQYSTSCPQFKAGFECAFLPFLNSHKVDTMEDLIESMKDLLGANMRRAHLQTIMETLSGQAPSLELSESLNMLFTQLSQMQKNLTELGEDSLTIETEDSSIINRLFGSVDTLIDETKEAIDVESSQIVEADYRDVADEDKVDSNDHLSLDLQKELAQNLDFMDSLSAKKESKSEIDQSELS